MKTFIVNINNGIIGIYNVTVKAVRFDYPTEKIKEYVFYDENNEKTGSFKRDLVRYITLKTKEEDYD